MGANGNNNPDPNQNSGSSSSSSSDANAFQPWAPPGPQSTWGVNSTVAYGEAATAVMGPNNSVTFGNNAQYCINPASLMASADASFPEIVKKVVGMGGVGGNLSFTLGANCNVVLGPSYEVLYGGKKSFHIGAAWDKEADKAQWEPNTVCKETNMAFGLVITALVLSWFIGFGETSDENSRIELLLSLQSVLSILASVMLGVDFAFDETHTTLTDALKALFVGTDPQPSVQVTKKMVGTGIASVLAALVEPVILPSIVSASEENHWGSSIS